MCCTSGPRSRASWARTAPVRSTSRWPSRRASTAQRGESSLAWVFLDKVGHYSTEALIPIAFGIRVAAYPFESPEDFLWTTLAVLLALVIVLNKALIDMVNVARANAGLTKLADTRGEQSPTPGRIYRLRRLADSCCSTACTTPSN